MRMTAVLCKLFGLAGLDIMNTLVGHLPWSCHSQDLLGVFHQLLSAVFPRGPHLIVCACGNLAATEGQEGTEKSQGTGLTKIQSP